MLLTDRRATVRLHFEVFYFMHLYAIIKSLSSHFSEFLLAYLNKRTLLGDHSLPVKVGTGLGQSLASDRGKASRQEKQVNCEVEISTGSVDRWLMSKPLTSGPLPCKPQAVSFYYGVLMTGLTTLSIRKKRSENSLAGTEHPENAQPQNVIPVNHNEVKVIHLHGNRVAQTINTSCYLWGRGPVVLFKGRGLNTGYLKGNRSYSTKTTSEAPSWNDTKVAKRLQSLWNGNKKDQSFVNEGLWKLLDEIDLWTAAYIKLSRSKGSNTASLDRATIDGTTLEKLISLKEDLIRGKHTFGTTKRLYIPKANGKLRP